MPERGGGGGGVKAKISILPLKVLVSQAGYQFKI